MESQGTARGAKKEGAASMEPWHFSHGEVAGRQGFHGVVEASMEPWHFSHGELGVCEHGARQGHRFNGAMAF